MSRSITQKCKVENCDSLGRLNKNGRRYLTKGYCGKHYHHITRYGKIITTTVFDYRHAVKCRDYYKIPLGINGKDGYALVDNKFKWLDKYKWHKLQTGYAATTIYRKTDTMHSIINGILKIKKSNKMDIDHINLDKLDNRLSNLRACTRSQNIANTPVRKSNKLGVKGVLESNGKYYGFSLGKRIGPYNNVAEAAKAIDDLYVKRYGEYALTNKMAGMYEQ